MAKNISPVIKISSVGVLFVLLLLAVLAIWDVIDVSSFQELSFNLGLTFLALVAFVIAVAFLTPSNNSDK